MRFVWLGIAILVAAALLAAAWLLWVSCQDCFDGPRGNRLLLAQVGQDIGCFEGRGRTV